MLLLSFHIGSECYAIAASTIVEVLPLTTLKKIPQAPDFVVGLLDYRGKPLPVIDLCRLSEGRSHNKVLSSRIILVQYENKARHAHTLGLIAEKVTETFDVEADEFDPAGIELRQAPYLGAINNRQGEMIQLIEVDMLLTDEIRDMLFPETVSEVQASA